ncbi:type VII secretion integral membrane protein EccD [Mycolicibacterium sp. ND9-15]|uniref:type VII secretion integral membrane protein EccD n=1 Tax=Mycolicibacterium sp. ND9-15 TaxID=3042320 RepID=UPI002DD9F06A|nr:type VII secretion integral membrane protein EccD [Mycolicibacterium sp. ND9-15]WSE57565.1 type VII secretion integral membrane protein EccD [Mycolicibacterium sp. ND9-15]
MPDSLCRVTVHLGHTQNPQAVDLALPKTACLGEMLPAIVELVHADRTDPWTGERWRLRRVGGLPLDESLTLPGNNIRDGELLWLTTNLVPAPVVLDRDSTRTVARLGPSQGSVPRQVYVGASLVAAGIGGTAIVWSARCVAGTGPVVTGAGLSVAAVTAAIVARRTLREPLLCIAFSALAAILAAATGAVAVPAGPPAAHLLLASTTALTVAVVCLRFTGRGHTPLTGIVTASLLCAATSAGALAWDLDAVTSGALLAALALAGLSSAPRVAILLTRIGPTPPDADGPDAEATVGEDRPTLAHDMLTGMIVGAAVVAAVGTLLVGIGSAYAHEVSVAVAAFCGVVGTTLLLRARTHIGTVRRCALTVSGFVCIATVFAVAVASAPQRGHWFGALGVVAGAVFLIPLLGLTPSLTARRAAELAEYAMLAAVIPLACWVAGVFGVVRDLALT